MTLCPAGGLPSQTCRLAAKRFPLAGTIRSVSTASGVLVTTGAGGGAGSGVLAGRAARCGGSRGGRSWPFPAGWALAVNRDAGVAMPSDWQIPEFVAPLPGDWDRRTLRGPP